MWLDGGVGEEGQASWFSFVSPMYTGSHVIKLVFVFVVLPICLLQGVSSAKSPEKWRGNYFSSPAPWIKCGFAEPALRLGGGRPPVFRLLGQLNPRHGPRALDCSQSRALAQDSGEDQRRTVSGERLEGPLHEDSSE